MTAVPTILCDAVKSVDIYHGVARIVLVRVSAGGVAEPVVEIAIAVSQLAALVRAISPSAGK